MTDTQVDLLVARRGARRHGGRRADARSPAAGSRSPTAWYRRRRGRPGPEPPSRRSRRPSGCLVTPGLINTHHHIYQNLTRAYRPALDGNLFDWLTHAVPAVEPARRGGGVRVGVGRPRRARARRLHDDDGSPLRAPARRRRPDHRRDRGRARARHAVPPDPRLDEPVARRTADCRRTRSCRTTTRSSPTPSGWWRCTTTAAPDAMVRVALAPCSPFSVTPELMRRTAELAERLDVRLHTHLAEDPDEDDFCLAQLRLPPDRALRATWAGGAIATWVAHCIHPNDDEIARLGAVGRPASRTARARTR